MGQIKTKNVLGRLIAKTKAILTQVNKNTTALKSVSSGSTEFKQYGGYRQNPPLNYTFFTLPAGEKLVSISMNFNTNHETANETGIRRDSNTRWVYGYYSHSSEPQRGTIDWNGNKLYVSKISSANEQMYLSFNITTVKV